MSLFITSLNSGSNGNCYYIGNQNEAILVDAGIPCREIEKRLARLGLSITKIKGVFVSHEHTDHIKGICGLVKKYRVPVYITYPTLSACGFGIDEDLIKSFTPNSPVTIGGLSVTAFTKFHDACDPYSFVISCNDIKVGVFTDIGVACKNVIHHFKQCHAVFLEANYETDMLEKGNYPYYLKKRIMGGNGHLSNSQALALFTTHKAPFMTHLLLSHLSRNNNCPDLVKKMFTDYASGVEIIIASRDSETPVAHIYNTTAKMVKRKTLFPSSQLAFSFT